MGLVTALQRELQRWEEIIDPGPTHVDDIWTKVDVGWGSLVGSGVSSGYLVRIDVS